MDIFKYEQSLQPLVNYDKPIIFLMGPTVRGNQTHLTSWRIEAVEIFKKKGFKGALIIPEFTSKFESDKGKDWIPAWEFAGLQISDVNMCWVPRTKELIGLTTNAEWGYWLARDSSKLIYGRPDDAYRISYLDLMWDFNSIQNGQVRFKINKTLEETIIESINTAFYSYEKRSNRVLSKVKVESPYGPFEMR